MTQQKSAAAESWIETSDAVLRGLNHEFSNRLSFAILNKHAIARMTRITA